MVESPVPLVDKRPVDPRGGFFSDFFSGETWGQEMDTHREAFEREDWEAVQGEVNSLI